MSNQFHTGSTAPNEPHLVRIPVTHYLAVVGSGAPQGPKFQSAVQALFGTAYAIKMRRRKMGGRDFSVGPVEAQWWSATGEPNLSTVPQSEWRWKVMITVPSDVAIKEVDQVRSAFAEHEDDVDGVELVTLHEDRCVEALHVGPYGDEARTLGKMQTFLNERHLFPKGPHHEIYLSDPRNTPQERLQTLLRWPVGEQQWVHS